MCAKATTETVEVLRTDRRFSFSVDGWSSPSDGPERSHPPWGRRTSSGKEGRPVETAGVGALDGSELRGTGRERNFAAGDAVVFPLSHKYNTFKLEVKFETVWCFKSTWKLLLFWYQISNKTYMTKIISFGNAKRIPSKKKINGTVLKFPWAQKVVPCQNYCL